MGTNSDERSREILARSTRTGEVFYVNGIPFELLELPDQDHVMGAIHVPTNRIWLHLQNLTPRRLAAWIHEPLHGIDETVRLTSRLKHNDIRRISSALNVTFRDKRNVLNPVFGHIIP